MIKTLSTRLDEAMKRELKSHGLTLSQFAILMTLLEQDDASQSEIGRRISMPGYATTRNIDVLEEKGLLARHRHEVSRRSHSIRLTSKGHSMGPQLFSIVADVNTRLLAGLGKTPSAELKALLTRLLPHSQSLIRPEG